MKEDNISEDMDLIVYLNTNIDAITYVIYIVGNGESFLLGCDWIRASLVKYCYKKDSFVFDLPV